MEDPFEISNQPLPRRRVERGEGLVEEDDLRFRHESPGEARPLRLPAGELPGGAPGEVADAEKLQIAGNGPRRSPPRPTAADTEAGGDIVEDGRIEEERLLENHCDVSTVVEIPPVRDPLPRKMRLPLSRFQQTGQRQQERRFSRAVRTDQGKGLSLNRCPGRGSPGQSPRPDGPGGLQPLNRIGGWIWGFIEASPAAGSGSGWR